MSSNKPPLQIPNHLCKTKEAVVEVFGESQTRRALEGFEAKTKEYGNPIERRFVVKPLAISVWLAPVFGIYLSPRMKAFT